MLARSNAIELSSDSTLTRAICDAAADAIFVKDLQGRYTYVNPSCARLFHATPSEMIGTTDDEWFGAEVGARLRAEDREALARGETHIEETHRIDDGVRVFSTTKTSLVDAGGTVLGVVGIARDITASAGQRRAVLAERDLFATMASVVPAAFLSFVANADGTYAVPFASPSVAALYGSTPEELRDTPLLFFQRMHPADIRRVREELDVSARELTPFRSDYRLDHPERGEIWIEVASGPIRQPDGGTLWHGIVLDITERKRVERQLREQKEMLEGIASSSPGAIHTFQMDADGEFSFPYVSDAMRHIYGMSSTEISRSTERVFALIHPDDRERVNQLIERSAETMTPWRCEFRVNNPLRGEIWVEGHSCPTKAPGGGISWHGVLLDVTDRKRVEAELLASESTLRAVVETVPDFLMLVERDGKISFINHVLPGLTKEDVIGKHASVFLAPSMGEAAMEVVNRVLTTGTPEVYDAKAIVPGGEYRWFETRIGPVIQDGQVVAVALATTDVTDRRLAAEKIQASEAALRSVLETTPDLILSVDRDVRIRFINHVMPHHDRSQIIGTDALAYLSEETRKLAEEKIRHVFETRQIESYEAELSDPAGPRWLATRVGPVVENDVVVGATLTATDLTERKHMESALRASEERYRMLMDFLPEPVFLNVEGKIAFCNPAFVRLMRASSAEQLLGLSPFDVFHADDHEKIRERIAMMAARNEPVAAREERIVAMDGTERLVSVVATPVVDKDQGAILVVLHDLTEKEKTERLLASVLESASDAIVTITAEGEILTINATTSHMFGYTAEELVGENVKLLMPEPHRAEHDGYLRRFRQRGASTVIGREREVTGLRKDGQLFPIELTVSAFRLNGKQHYTGVIRDMTERKKLEEEFRQAHKMEAFGQLAGGVAHDFNNLLTVIIGENELLAGEIGDNEEAAASLTAVAEAADRAASLTRQLLAFSRKTVLEPKILDVNAVVRETEKLLRRLIGEDIQLSTRLTPNPVHVHVDPGQLTQVLMNLAVNARDAMPKGGELEIRTWPVVVEDDSVYEDLSPGRYVAISVRDSGVGMPEEVRRQVFQPFFTTKEIGKGTGLGLAVVHGIVAQSGGTVRVQSEPGVGTIFEILLPAARSTWLDNPDDRDRTSRPPIETILVVEDDEAVRKFAMRVLSMRGYRVLLAPDGATAVTMLESHAAPVDLVLTDVVMPVMDGTELGERLRDRFPETKLLYVSGYTADALLLRGLESDTVDFLAKPYTPSTLVQAVERVLARP